MSRPHLGMVFVALTLWATACAAPALAIDPITWRTLDCGGVSFVTAGNLRLGATIGQSDAGTASGGTYTLRGGFWIGGLAGTLDAGDGAATPRVFRFLPAWPNPVRSRSRVAFELPRTSRVALSVFDVSGRLLRRADFGLLPAGRHERAWNAEDGDGRALPNGVYFLRLDSGSERGTHKVLVLH